MIESFSFIRAVDDFAGSQGTELNQNYEDVLFLCVGHGEARKFLTDNPINAEIRLIDM